MFEPIHRKAAAIAFEHLQVSQDAIGKLAIEGARGCGDFLPIRLRALGHRLEGGAIRLAMIRHVCSLLSGYASQDYISAGRRCSSGIPPRYLTSGLPRSVRR